MTSPLRTAEDRRRDEEIVLCLVGEENQAPFTLPWELRAFAIAVAAHEAVQYDWVDFQRSLVESICRWEREASDSSAGNWNYYEHWLVALESVLEECDLLTEAAVDERTREILCTPRNANHHEASTEPIAIERPIA